MNDNKSKLTPEQIRELRKEIKKQEYEERKQRRDDRARKMYWH